MSLGFNAADILVMFPLSLIVLSIFAYYYCSLLDNKVDFYYYTISDTFVPAPGSPFRWLPYILWLITCTMLALINSSEYEIIFVGILQFNMLYLTQLVAEIQHDIHIKKIIDITENSQLSESKKETLISYSRITLMVVNTMHAVTAMTFFLFYMYTDYKPIVLFIFISIVSTAYLKFYMSGKWPIERLRELKEKHPYIVYIILIMINSFAFVELISFIYICMKLSIRGLLNNKEFVYSLLSNTDLDIIYYPHNEAD